MFFWGKRWEVGSRKKEKKEKNGERQERNKEGMRKKSNRASSVITVEYSNFKE